MARFLALSRRFVLLVAAGILLPGFTTLLAAPPTTNAPPANPKPPTPPASATTAPATPPKPATTTTTAPAPPAKPPAPVVPPPPVLPPDPFSRYGNILQPGNEPAHPLRLDLPFPDVGEIKVPTEAELTMREKLEELAMLTDDQIRDQLSKWPPFTKMSLKDEGMMLARIQDFRERRVKIAQQAAHDIGLLTLNPMQQARFEIEYWAKRLPMERDVAKQVAPILKQHEAQLNEELYREFSSPAVPLAQTPPKPATPPPAAKPPTPPASSAPAKPTPAPAVTQTTNKPVTPTSSPTANKPAATTSTQTMEVGATGTQPMH